MATIIDPISPNIFFIFNPDHLDSISINTSNDIYYFSENKILFFLTISWIKIVVPRITANVPGHEYSNTYLALAHETTHVVLIRILDGVWMDWECDCPHDDNVEQLNLQGISFSPGSANDNRATTTTTPSTSSQ